MSNMEIIKCKFATESDLEQDDFRELLRDFHTKNWSRMWEYPFVVLNSKLEPGQEVLVAGCCGDELPGYFSQRKMRVTGIDLQNCGRDFFRFIEGDLRNMPFADQLFDHVFCISVLEHLKTDPFKAFMELVRVCKSGGRVIITTDYNRSKSAYRFSHQDFDLFCGKMGIDTPKLPDDVLKSEATEDGKRCGIGLSVCGFVIKC